MPSAPPASLARALCAALAIPLVAAVVTTPLPLRAQATFGAIIFALTWLVARFPQRWVSLVMIAVSLSVSTRYMVFRLTATLPEGSLLNVAFGGLLLIAELYAFTMLVLGYVQSAWPISRRPVTLPADTDLWPTVDVFVPTYNEALDIVAPTVYAARAIDWPASKLRVYILDDGCRPELKAFAAEVGVEYFERKESTHAKAGNINKALGRTSGEYILILDCDHAPARSFLQLTMGWLMRDPKLAMLQTPHHFYSPDPFERNLGSFRKQPNEGELFYALIQRGNDLWNAAFFCGSCAVLQRRALTAVGGIAVETVTEDAHTALRMQRHGYKTAYLDIPQVAGLATERLIAHVGQRTRWARGMVQIFRTDNPLLGRGLSLGQRLCYAAAMLHFLFPIPRLIFLLAPLSYLFFGAQILRGAPALVLAYALPHLAHSVMTSSRLQGRHRYSFWSEIYETALAPFLALPTSLALIAPRLGSFNVTAKGGSIEKGYFDLRTAVPHLLLIGLNLLGIALGGLELYAGGESADVALLNVLWCVYNVFLLAPALAVAAETRQRRGAHRVDLNLPATLKLEDGHLVQASLANMSLTGARIRVHGSFSATDDTALWLCLRSPRPAALPARVVASRDAELHLRFDEDKLSTDARSALAESIFSRGDAWIDWNHGRRRDRPFSELFHVGLHGVRGLGHAMLALVRFGGQKHG